MSFLIPSAYAADAPVPPQSNPYSFFIMLAVFGLIMYFMIIRPQQRRAKEHRKLMESIGKGDEVMTNGGLIGRVIKLADNGYLLIALNDTTEVVIKRDFVTAVLPKGSMKKVQ